jgi:hypothetical protein
LQVLLQLGRRPDRAIGELEQFVMEIGSDVVAV